MREKLARGAPDELLTLMRASNGAVNASVAKTLHDAGYDDARGLAAADVADLQDALARAAAFDPSATRDRFARLARTVVDDAKAHVARADRRTLAASPSDDDGDDSSDDSEPDPDLPVASDDDDS